MKNEIKTGADALSATPRTDAVRNLMNCDSIADDFSTWFEHSCALERELSETTHRLRIVEQESREMKMAAADPRIADEPSSVTIVYKITDVAEWRKTNPLRYEHHGLKAHTVAAYDAVVERNAYREELLRLRKMMDNEDADAVSK